ncbi:cytochrome P450 [Streptomyces sp. NPDC127068]|uniref:cytochrome P450 n=1 Tax=Streptomyces sp. NPDC127068 TaxID=3347127 RepID=UPI003653083E
MSARQGCPASHGFDPLDASYTVDPFPVLARLRAESPTFYASELDMWVVTRYRDVERILKDTERFSGANTQRPAFPLGPRASEIVATGSPTTPTLSNGPEPKHGRVRSHCLKAFSARRLARLEPVIQERAEELVDRMLTQHRFDIVQKLTYPLPASIVFALIGFPREDWSRLKSLAADRMLFTWGRPTANQQVAVARRMSEYWTYCTEFVDRQLAYPEDCFTGDLARSHHDDPEALTADEITNVVHAVSFAGHETTTSVATSAIMRLMRHREQWDALCEDPHLIPQAVEEALRYDPALFTWRRVTTVDDADLGTTRVPAGTPVLLVIGSANHDETQFDAPDAFNIRREGARRHLTFGKGGHYCFGAPLARMEIAAMLATLSARAPGLRLSEDQEPPFHVNLVFHGPSELFLERDRGAART